jgi:hypothetical protein
MAAPVEVGMWDDAEARQARIPQALATERRAVVRHRPGRLPRSIAVAALFTVRYRQLVLEKLAKP